MRFWGTIGELAILATLPAGGARAGTDAAYLAAGKRVPVHRLEAALPRLTLERWFLALVGPKARVSWEVNDCGEACGCPADSGRDLPVCTEVSAKLENGDVAAVSISVGTNDRGVFGPPAFADAYLMRGKSTTSFRSLSAFARAVRKTWP